MSPSRLKNIVLLILLLANLLLLGQVILRERQSEQYRRAALNDAISILAGDGITILPETVPSEPLPAALYAERDTAAEAAAAVALLGPEAESERSSGAVLTTYHSPAGTLRFYSDGYFEAVLVPGAYPAENTPQDRHAADTLALLGFSGTVTELDETGVTLLQTQGGFTVFSCAARADYRDGSLTALSGYRIPGPTRSDGTEALSPATLLLRFRAAVRAKGDVCSEIVSVEAGYSMSASFTGSVHLLPALRITIDGNRTYFMDIRSGELRTG